MAKSTICNPDKRYLAEGFVRVSIIQPRDHLEWSGITEQLVSLRQRGYSSFKLLPLDVAFDGDEVSLSSLYRNGLTVSVDHIVYAKTTANPDSKERSVERDLALLVKLNLPSVS